MSASNKSKDLNIYLICFDAVCVGMSSCFTVIVDKNVCKYTNKDLYD